MTKEELLDDLTYCEACGHVYTHSRKNTHLCKVCELEAEIKKLCKIVEQLGNSRRGET